MTDLFSSIHKPWDGFFFVRWDVLSYSDTRSQHFRSHTYLSCNFRDIYGQCFCLLNLLKTRRLMLPMLAMVKTRGYKFKFSTCPMTCSLMTWMKISPLTIYRPGIQEVEVPECGCKRKQYVAKTPAVGPLAPRCSTKTAQLRGTGQKVLTYCMYGELDYFLNVSTFQNDLIWLLLLP